MDEKKPYRVKPGFRYGASNELGPGEIVYLTDEEVGGFLDKLEPTQVPAPPVPKEPEKSVSYTGGADDGLAKDDDPSKGTGEDKTPEWFPFVAEVADVPADVALIPDDVLLTLRGIGAKRLEAIRAEYPYIPQEPHEDEESEDEGEKADGAESGE